MPATITYVVKQLQQQSTDQRAPEAILTACRGVAYRWRESTLNPMTTRQVFLAHILHGNTACTGGAPRQVGCAPILQSQRGGVCLGHPSGQTRTEQSHPPAIERHHCRQRHWCGRVKHTSIMISTSPAMVELTMALFAKFWVSGNQDKLLSLLPRK